MLQNLFYVSRSASFPDRQQPPLLFYEFLIQKKMPLSAFYEQSLRGVTLQTEVKGSAGE